MPSLVLLSSLVGCGNSPERGSFACGFAALSAPLAVQQAFMHGQALAEAPWSPPDSIPVRVAAGPLHRAAVVAVEQRWQVTLADSLAATPVHGHAVLVTDPRAANLGIVLFEGPPIPGAAVLGSIQTTQGTLPLLGVSVPRSSIDQPGCPLFERPSS